MDALHPGEACSSGRARMALPQEFAKEGERGVAASTNVAHVVAASRAVDDAGGARNCYLRASRPDMHGIAVDRLWETLNGPLIEAAMELGVAGRTDPSLRLRLAEAQREAISSVAVVARHLLPDKAVHPGFVGLISTVLAALRGMVLLGFVSPEDRDAAYAAGRRHLLDMIAAWEPGS